jgi:hypothetical protein
MTAITVTIVISAAVYAVSLLVMLWRLIETQARLDRTETELQIEHTRRLSTEDQALQLVEKVTPLIEKTDWMTGRWSGQFSTLLRMENDRNDLVDNARRSIWSIPLVADHIKNNYGATK